MPLFKIRESDLVLGGLLEETVHKIFALMFYPEDEGARSSYIASFVYDRANRIADALGPQYQVDVRFFRRGIYLSDPENLADRALEPAVRSPAKTGNGEEMTAPGVAGNILLQAFAFQSRGQIDIGLIKCIEAQSQHYRKKGASLGSTVRNLKEIWHRYRSVAHIVAAFIIYDKQLGSAGEWLTDPFAFIEFLRLANTMMARGETIGDKHAQDPILRRGEGWEFVIAPCAALSRTGSKFSGPGPKF